APVTVDLQAHSATNIGGGAAAGFANIDNLVGGASTTLVGPDNNSGAPRRGNGSGDVNGTFTFYGLGNLAGGALDDRFVLTAGKGVGLIGGGAGSNTLDYSAYPAPVTVNLQAQSATNIDGGSAGGFANIDNLVGGAGSDTLVGA